MLKVQKAALTRAFRERPVDSDSEWRRVRSFKKVAANCKVFPNEQLIKRRLDDTSGGFYDLMKSALLTDARYAELTNPRVSNLDRKEGTLYVTGNTGARDCHLPNAAVTHFRRLSRD